MAKLIKGEDLFDEIKAIPWDTPRPAAAFVPPKPPRAATQVCDPRHDEAQARIESLEHEIADLKSRHQADLKLAFEKGREDARATQIKQEKAAIERLAATLSDAVQRSADHIGSVEQLALLLCETSLNNLSAQPSAQKELLAHCVRQQIAHLKSELVLAVWVNRHDFSDEAQLQGLAAELKIAAQIRMSDDLAPGDCRIELRLGHIDISMSAYWESLRAELRNLSQIGFDT